MLALAGRLAPLSVGQRQANVPAGEIQGSFTVGQSFFSPYPGLYRIDVVLATYGRTNTGKVTFNLAGGTKRDARLLSMDFDASDVRNNFVRTFEFQPMGDSAGKTYFFNLEAPTSRPGNAITAWTDSTNPYPDGMAYLGGQIAENDLAFVAYYQPTPWQALDIYLDRIARGKPGFLGSKAFYTAAFFVYFALAGALLALLARRPLAEGQA